jgi:hypothetical protein
MADRQGPLTRSYNPPVEGLRVTKFEIEIEIETI